MLQYLYLLSMLQSAKGELESGAFFTTESLTMQMESWVGAIEREDGISCVAPTPTGCRKVLASRHCGKQDWIPVTGVARRNRKRPSHQHVKPCTLSGPLVTGAHWREPPSGLANGNGHFSRHTNRRGGGL